MNVRDIAVGLLRRGHQPVVYSPDLGEMAEEIRAATVAVVDDLDGVAVDPDVIHGHHHTVTLEALLRFPGVPAVFFVHDWSAWHDEPLRFPRVALYAPVDATNADRIMLEHGIPPERVRVLLNAVDLQRFPRRPALPARPSAGLVFSNYAAESNLLPAVREACRRTGVELAVVGALAGTPAARPEEVLGGFDLVFAKARCALEAMAVGAAVVLCDGARMGPLVTAADFSRLRPLNFGRRTLDRPLTIEGLVREIERYDAADAQRVTERVREEADLEALLDGLLAVYDEATTIGRLLPSDPAAEARATAAYLRRWAPQYDTLRASDREAQRLAARLTEVDGERARLAAEIEASHGEVERTARAKQAEHDERRHLGRDLAEARGQLRDARAELAWMTASATWRWRERLLRLGVVRVAYRQWLAATGLRRAPGSRL